MARAIQDRWADWLLKRRHGGDEARHRSVLEFLAPIRDRVLDRAQLNPDDVVLDVGAGDGLIGFGALDQLGDHGRVIFSDISTELLDQCREIADELGVADQCRFMEASADDLSTLDDDSVDVVTVRSVLIYVATKRRAFNEFHRVLRPGGRLSIFEPINRFTYPEPPGTFAGYDVTPVRDLAEKVKAIFERYQPPDDDPMLDFDERDLIHLAEQAGFCEIHQRYEVDIEPSKEPMAWEAFVHSSFNPRLPTLDEAMREGLTQREIDALTNHLKPLVESGRGASRGAQAYLWARPPRR